jgi:uncharacterized protein YukE
MKVKVKLEDVQSDKRYVIDVFNPKATSFETKRYGVCIQGKNVHTWLSERPYLRVTSLKEQIYDVAPETRTAMLDLYQQMLDLIEAVDNMSDIVQKEMTALPAGYEGHIQGGYDDELNNLNMNLWSSRRNLIKVCNSYASQIYIDSKYESEDPTY